MPVLLVLGMYLRNAASHAGGQGKGAKLPIPWFAIGFLALAIINSLNILPADAVAALRRLDVFALTMAMTALGIETRFAQIRRPAPRRHGPGPDPVRLAAGRRLRHRQAGVLSRAGPQRARRGLVFPA